MSSNHNRLRIGLALSGGVARGPVHVGVLSVLEREGIPIDFVAGASAGALVGASYCAGMSIPDLCRQAVNMRWRDVAGLTWPRSGFLSFAKIERYLESYLGVLDIRDLSIPFAVAVTDLDRGEPVILRTGRLATAVHASCAVPGIVQPVIIDGRCCCDGGVSDNLPVDAVRQMGADFVIGVDLFVPVYRRYWGPFGAGLAAVEILVRQAGGGCKEADCLIVPDLSGHNYFNFSKSKSRAYIALGKAAAERALPQIRAALGLPIKQVAQGQSKAVMNSIQPVHVN